MLIMDKFQITSLEIVVVVTAYIDVVEVVVVVVVVVYFSPHDHIIKLNEIVVHSNEPHACVFCSRPDI